MCGLTVWEALSHLSQWTAGVTLWEVIEARLPYSVALSNLQVAEGISSGKLQLQKPQAEWLPEDMWKLMSQCLQFNASDRPTFDNILSALRPQIAYWTSRTKSESPS